MDYYCIHPTAMLRVRHIERDVNVPLPSAIKYAKELAKESFLKTNTIAGATLYTADRTSPTYLLEKKLHNIRSLHETRLIAALKETFHNAPLVLFGSYARGEDTENSDIDIYIQTPTTHAFPCTRYEKKLKRSIQLFQYNTIHDVENKELANNIINGITLNGFIEVFT